MHASDASPPGFHLEDFSPQARRNQLSPAQARALNQALSALSTDPDAHSEAASPEWPEFFLPLAESGLTAETMLRLAALVPTGWPLDHRLIYFDFRLGRWGKHLEPATFEECLEDYLEHSESPQQAIAFLRGRWDAFLKRHGF